MDDNTKVSIDEIRLWDIEDLRKFLRSKGLKSSGEREELAALVFAAKGMPQLLTQSSKPTLEDEDEERVSPTPVKKRIKREYEELLEVPSGENLPDPSTLARWESEVDSIGRWPPTMGMEIGLYLKGMDNQDLCKRLIAEYKRGISPVFLGKVQYHGIDEDSPYCFLQSWSRLEGGNPHMVWVAAHKMSGEVHRAYCTCLSGYNSTCHHIAALLFRLDSVWNQRNEVPNPPFVSTPMPDGTRNMEHEAEQIQPKRIRDMCWEDESPNFIKGKKNGKRKRRTSRPRHVSSPAPTLAALTEALYPAFKDAAVFEYINIPRRSKTNSCPDS